MATDYVTIANLATGFFGDDFQISSPDEDSKAARAVASVWDQARRFVLAKGEWNFAMRRVDLTARSAPSDNPVLGYESAFPVPPDYVRLVEILEPAECVENYEFAADKDGKAEILADTTGALRIRYVRDHKEPSLWSPGFVEALAMRIAWQLADQLSGDKQRKQQALAAYKDAIREAKGADAKQNPPRRHAETDWSRARRTGLGTSAAELRAGRH